MSTEEESTVPVPEPVAIEGQAQKAQKIAYLLGLLSIFPKSKMLEVVSVAPNITARRVPNGIYYQHVIVAEGNQLAHVHSETRTDLEEQKCEVIEALEELGHEFED